MIGNAPLAAIRDFLDTTGAFSRASLAYRADNLASFERALPRGALRATVDGTPSELPGLCEASIALGFEGNRHLDSITKPSPNGGF